MFFLNNYRFTNLGSLLSFNQKNFCITSRVSTEAVALGNTRGRGSTTRIYNWVNTHI